MKNSTKATDPGEPKFFTYRTTIEEQLGRYRPVAFIQLANGYTERLNGDWTDNRLDSQTYVKQVESTLAFLSREPVEAQIATFWAWNDQLGSEAEKMH